MSKHPNIIISHFICSFCFFLYVGPILYVCICTHVRTHARTKIPPIAYTDASQTDVGPISNPYLFRFSCKIRHLVGPYLLIKIPFPVYLCRFGYIAVGKRLMLGPTHSFGNTNQGEPSHVLRLSCQAAQDVRDPLSLNRS